MMLTKNPEVAYQFAQLPYKKKICFIPTGEDNEHIIALNFYKKLHERWNEQFWNLVNHIATGHYQYLNLFDLLLDGKKTITVDLKI